MAPQPTAHVLLLLSWVYHVAGHGRLWDPPARGTMWRRGFNTPVNYNDNALNCGGFYHQVSQGYKCGLCGDPYDGPRENETGGRFATGKISRTYSQRQKVTIQVDLTANHKGYFEFKICPTHDPKVKETQACFDKYPLSLARSSGSGTKFYVGSESKMYKIDVKLPRNLHCKHCVLQWRYHAGNNWGTDPNRQSCVGCGPQEEFYGCADIAIKQEKHSHTHRKSSPLAGY